jgi:hypothetical protein
MPGPLAPGSHGLAKLADLYARASWLVMFFEQLVLARDNRKAMRLGGKVKPSVADKRRWGWYRSALSAVDQHSLTELAEVCDAVFAYNGGDLPLVVPLDGGAYGFSAKDLTERTAKGKSLPDLSRKVTRLSQITYPSHFKALSEWRCNRSSALPETGP